MTYRNSRKVKHNPHSNAKPLTPEQVERALGGSVLVKPRAPLSGGAIEAQQIMEKAKQLKGNTMPDFKTALSNALENGKRQALNATLDAWEKDEKETQLEKPVKETTHLFEVTNNVSRETFNYVRDNPLCLMADIKRDLGAKGFNVVSVGSLLTQFVHQRHINRSADGEYTTINKEYKPLMTRAKWEKLHGMVAKKTPKAVKRKIVVVKRRTAEEVEQARKVSGIETLTQPVVASAVWTPESVVNTLSVMQARQLYDVLKNIFGG